MTGSIGREGFFVLRLPFPDLAPWAGTIPSDYKSNTLGAVEALTLLWGFTVVGLQPGKLKKVSKKQVGKAMFPVQL